MITGPPPPDDFNSGKRLYTAYKRVIENKLMRVMGDCSEVLTIKDMENLLKEFKLKQLLK